MLKYLRDHFNNTKANRLLFTLLLIDVILILVHVAVIVFFHAKWTQAQQDPFMIDVDLSYPEYFQYLKYILIALISILLINARKRNFYIAWALLFIYLLLDDSMQFHEHVGQWVTSQLNIEPMFGLRGQDLGELIYDLLMGMVLLLPMVLCYKRGSVTFRRTNIDIGMLLIVFLFFGVGVDMLSIMFDSGNVGYLLTILEDGGEMLALSFLTWYFSFLLWQVHYNGPYLYQYFTPKKGDNFLFKAFTYCENTFVQKK
jgi:hypothetical protein